MSAIISLIIANLPAIIKTGEAGIAWVASIRKSAQQSKEWPPEAEAAFVNALLQDSLGPEWNQD